MHRLFVLPLVAACASGQDAASTEAATDVSVVASGAEEPSAVAEPTAPMLTPDVAAFVAAHPRFDGWSVVPLAQLERANRVVVILWPAIAPSGQILDDDIIGLTLERGEVLSLVDENWASRGDAYLAHLGGEPTSRDRGEGVAASQLAERLMTLPAQFAERMEVGDRVGAVDRAIAFSRLFAFEHAVISDTVSELLILHTQGGRIEAEALEPGRVRAQFFAGADMTEAEVLIATEVAPERWVFTDHERIDAGVR